MEHSAIVRPELPGTTPSPGPMGRRSVYSTKLPPSFPAGSKTTPTAAPVMEETESPTNRTEVRPTMKKTNQRAVYVKTIHKIVNKLPYQLRESVLSAFEMVLTTSEDAQKLLEMSRAELSSLREQLAKKSADVQTFKRQVESYKDKIRGMEESIEVLKDNIESNQRFTVKNKSAIGRLASTNRMLFDSLEALQANTDAEKQLLKSSTVPNLNTLDTEQNDVLGGNSSGQPRGGKLLPIKVGSAKHLSPSKRFNKDNEESLYQNDKLRESLLRVAREHYKSMKYAENLDATVTELRVALRMQEQQNRKLKAEVEEYRALLQTEHTDEKVTSGGDVGNIKTNQRNFDVIDQRLQTMIEKNGFDPIDGIQLLRRIVAHQANAPNNLSTHNMVLHMVSKEAARIFDVDMLCIFVKPPAASDATTMHRFTMKSSSPSEVNLTHSSSLAGVVMRSSKVTRVNVISNSVFNHDVDCVVGVAAKRCMSLPLYNVETRQVFGCIHMINKKHNDLFSDTDELFGLIFADQASLLLTSCNQHDALLHHAVLLQNLLESSTSLFNVIPDQASLNVTRSLSPGIVLTALEEIAKEVLKCSDARAFLVSDYLNMNSGQLVMLEKVNMTSVSKDVAVNSILSVPIGSGIAGHVVQSKCIYEMDSSGYDMYVNPTVDVDPLISSMVAVPIMDLYGVVVGCLELVVGPRSPGLRHSDELKDQGLLFMQAAQWLTHQLATPLQYLVHYIGRPVNRPISTPNRINRTPGKSRGNHHHFFGFQLDGADGRPPGTGHHPIMSGMTFGSQSPAPGSSGNPWSNNFSNRPFSGDKTSTGDFLSIPITEAPQLQQQQQQQQQLKTETSASVAAAAASNAELSRLKTENSEQQNQVTALKKNLQESQSVLEDTKIQLEEQLHLVQSTRTELEAAVKRCDEAEAHKARLENEVAAKTSTDDAMKALDKALRQQAASDENIAALTAEISKVVSERDELQRINDSDKQSMAALQQELVEMQASKTAAASNAEAQIQSDNESISAEKQRLEEELAARVSEIAQWTESYTSMETSYNEQKEYSEALQKDGEELRQQIASLQGTVPEVEQQLAEKDVQLSQLQQELQQSQQQVKEQQEKLEQQNAAAKDAEGSKIEGLQEVNKILQRKVEELTATVAQKDSVQALLQAQVLRMAGQNVKEIDKAITDATGVGGDASAEGSVVTGADSSSSPPQTAAATAEGTGVAKPPSSSAATAVGSLRTGPPPSNPPPLSRAASAVPPTPSSAAGGGQALTGTETNDMAGIGEAASIDSAWAPVTDDYGNTYFYNADTGESSWSNPDEPSQNAQGAVKNADGLFQKGDWVQNFDDNGQEYWVNQITGESAWELPATAAGTGGGTGAGGSAAAGAGDEEDDSSFVASGGGGGIYDTTNSQFSAAAGDYRIEI